MPDGCEKGLQVFFSLSLLDYAVGMPTHRCRKLGILKWPFRESRAVSQRKSREGYEICSNFPTEIFRMNTSNVSKFHMNNRDSGDFFLRKMLNDRIDLPLSEIYKKDTFSPPCDDKCVDPSACRVPNLVPSQEHGLFSIDAVETSELVFRGENCGRNASPRQIGGIETEMASMDVIGAPDAEPQLRMSPCAAHSDETPPSGSTADGPARLGPDVCASDGADSQRPPAAADAESDMEAWWAWPTTSEVFSGGIRVEASDPRPGPGAAPEASDAPVDAAVGDPATAAAADLAARRRVLQSLSAAGVGRQEGWGPERPASPPPPGRYPLTAAELLFLAEAARGACPPAGSDAAGFGLESGAAACCGRDLDMARSEAFTTAGWPWTAGPEAAAEVAPASGSALGLGGPSGSAKPGEPGDTEPTAAARPPPSPPPLRRRRPGGR